MGSVRGIIPLRAYAN